MHELRVDGAPGVGLEPTTYGLTVRRAANCATPEGAPTHTIGPSAPPEVGLTARDQKGPPVRLRTLIVLCIGAAVGYVYAKRALTRDEPAILKGPRDEAPLNPALRMISGQAQRLADQATVKSL